MMSPCAAPSSMGFSIVMYLFTEISSVLVITCKQALRREPMADTSIPYLTSRRLSSAVRLSRIFSPLPRWIMMVRP